MVTRDEMMERLLDVCPSFRPDWLAFLDYWKDDPGDLPLYGALAEYARHLIHRLEMSAVEDFPVIFQTVECLLLEGDEYVREAIVVGLLEDLQNLNLHSETKPEEFTPFLGPRSREAWNELYEFWDRVSLSDSSKRTRDGKLGVLPSLNRNMAIIGILLTLAVVAFVISVLW